MKTHTIIPGLYQRGAFHEFPREQKLQDLAFLKVETVICCCGPYDRDLDTGAVRYYHVPFSDGKKIPTQLLVVPVAAAVRSLRRGGGVLVHCRVGRNRSGLASALIVRQVRGVTGAEAMAVVRAGRVNALANPAFVAYLESLEAP